MEKEKRISLIYFGGCPNYITVRQMLIEIGLPFKEINQDNIQARCRDKKFSSPTILVDGEFIVYGGKTDSPYGTCSINTPNKHELETNIKTLI